MTLIYYYVIMQANSPEIKCFCAPPTECQFPGADLEINPTLESLCLSMTEHALGGKCPTQSLNRLQAALKSPHR